MHGPQLESIKFTLWTYNAAAKESGAAIISGATGATGTGMGGGTVATGSVAPGKGGGTPATEATLAGSGAAAFGALRVQSGQSL